MNNALAGSGGETIVKPSIAEAFQGKRIILLPVSEGGMNLKTTGINRLIETLCVKSLAGGKCAGGCSDRRKAKERKHHVRRHNPQKYRPIIG